MPAILGNRHPLFTSGSVFGIARLTAFLTPYRPVAGKPESERIAFRFPHHVTISDGGFVSRSQPRPVPLRPLPKYERKEAVEDQIRALPTVGSRECQNYVRMLGGGLFPETLVWLFRAAQYRDRELLEVVMERLLGRADVNGRFHQSVRLVIWEAQLPRLWLELESFLVQCAGKWGFGNDLDEVNEFRTLVHVHILERMCQGAERMPFWEVYFSNALRRLTTDTFRKLLRSRDVPVRLGSRTVPADPDHLPDSGLSPDQSERRALLLEEAILSLPEQERIVLELLYMNPAAPNGKRTQKEVAEILGVSERTVYNRLQRSRPRLKNDPRVAEILGLNAMAPQRDSPRRNGEGAEATHE